MEETKVIKVLLLSSQEIVVSEIEEIAAEFGDPNCKLTKPYKIVVVIYISGWKTILNKTR